MQEIIELQENSKLISEKICEYCKPLMLEKENRKERTRLLSSETDLQLALQYALETDNVKSCVEKLKLAREECDIITYTLRQLNQSTSLTIEIRELCLKVTAIIDKIITKADN